MVGYHNVSENASAFILKMEAVGFSESKVPYRFTICRHNPEDRE
jgi:hypothetical protein